MFYLDPGPKPGMSMAYWGPDLSKMFGGPQPAGSINFDATTNWDSFSASYDGTLATQYFVTIIEPNTKIPIPIPVPNLDILKAPLAAHAPTPLKSQQLRPIANKNPVGAALAGLAALFKTADVDLRQRTARRAALRPRFQGAAAGGGARRGQLLRRQVLREERDAQHQARRIQAEFYAVARRRRLVGSNGDAYERRRSDYYGIYRGTVVNNVDPDADRAHHGHGAGRGRHHALDLGDAVRADRGKADGHVHGAADRRGRLGPVRSGRSRSPGLDGRMVGQSRRRCRRWRSRVCPAIPTS